MSENFDEGAYDDARDAGDDHETAVAKAFGRELPEKPKKKPKEKK